MDKALFGSSTPISAGLSRRANQPISRPESPLEVMFARAANRASATDTLPDKSECLGR